MAQGFEPLHAQNDISTGNWQNIEVRRESRGLNVNGNISTNATTLQLLAIAHHHP